MRSVYLARPKLAGCGLLELKLMTGEGVELSYICNLCSKNIHCLRNYQLHFNNVRCFQLTFSSGQARLTSLEVSLCVELKFHTVLSLCFEIVVKTNYSIHHFKMKQVVSVTYVCVYRRLV
jgi:hypothetical protein